MVTKIGTNGRNVLSGGAGADILKGLGGNDDLSGLDGSDQLFGGTGRDNLFGGNGNDLLLPGPGAGVVDHVNGGAGIDTVSYADATRKVTVNLGSGTAGGAATGDVFTSVENLIGSRFNDTLTGADGRLVAGGAGDDVIMSQLGTLRGDAGFDHLFRSAAVERFIIQYNMGLDYIKTSGSFFDKLVASKAAFNLGSFAGGALDNGELQNSIDPFAVGALVRLIFDYTTTILWADRDGSGDIFQPVPIAVIPQMAAAGLDGSDFIITA